ncbi:MAG: hypothetical protein QOE62_1956, partial [Actinomycetota bacterium]|nr:hypothetical protein [Actinomycetota bacterium]
IEKDSELEEIEAVFSFDPIWKRFEREVGAYADPVSSSVRDTEANVRFGEGLRRRFGKLPLDRHHGHHATRRAR